MLRRIQVPLPFPELDRLPRAAWQSAGGHPKGCQLIGALLPALLSVTWSSPSALDPLHAQLLGLLFNGTFSRLCYAASVMELALFLFPCAVQSLLESLPHCRSRWNGQNRKSLSVSSNSPLGSPALLRSASLRRVVTLCNTSCCHISPLFTPNTTFPHPSRLPSSAAEQPGGGSTPSPGGAASAWIALGTELRARSCSALPARCSASARCCSQTPAGGIHLVVSRTDAGTWLQPLGSPGSLLVLNCLVLPE